MHACGCGCARVVEVRERRVSHYRVLGSLSQQKEGREADNGIQQCRVLIVRIEVMS